jgi:hypothetical protein
MTCGKGLLDQYEHTLGAVGYSRTADDLRLGTCTPDPCLNATPYEPQLQFNLGLPTGATVTSASITLRAYVNSAGSATFNVRDRCTDSLLGSCSITASGWAECTATLDPTAIGTGAVFLNLEVVTNECYVVIDALELNVTAS